jgi:hypothetical protein
MASCFGVAAVVLCPQVRAELAEKEACTGAVLATMYNVTAPLRKENS